MCLFLLSLTSAISIDFFYSPSCPHCQKVAPLVNDVINNNPNIKVNSFDVSQESYNVSGVPLIKIITADGRNIILQGSREIPQWLECEVNEMTTKECPTYINKCHGGSWFKR